MPISTARAATERPERYIKQLVSHMGHKATTELASDGRGTIVLERGRCELTPAPGHISLTAMAADDESLAVVQDVITRHLLRFAAQEELTVDWTAAYSAESMDIINPAVEDYLLANCTPADEVLRDLATETREATGGAAGMQVSHDEGALLTMLVRMVGARNAIEVGTFTGYSSICIARGLPEDGRLIACDVSTEWTSIAKRYWDRAGVTGRVDLKIGPAAETLRALPAGPGFDFAFIDADKAGYPAYYEEVVTRLRPGGLVVLDNVFMGGRVLDPAFQGDGHVAMRRMNEIVVSDDRVESVMLPVRDGLTLARKR